VADADELVKTIMRQRGFPVDDFEQRVAEIAADHPDVVDNYRAAWAIAERNRQGLCATEELRKALLHYEALIEELLESRESAEVRT
jgi:hypothetical protein